MTDQELAARSAYIGSTDAAAILGLSRWKTLLEVWAEKTKSVKVENVESIPMMVGKALESTVIALFEKETGIKIKSTNKRIYHPKYSFMSAQLDALIEGESAFLEAKTCTIRKAKEWEGDDEIPTEYIIQCMHDLACVPEFTHCYIGVLIGNEDFKWRKIMRDEKMIVEMEKRESDFWNNFVIPKIMPKTVSAKDDKILYKLFPVQEPGLEINLGDEGAKLAEMRNALIQDMIGVESQIEKLENTLKLMMQEAETGMAGGYKVTWKAQKRAGYTVKPSEFRTFRCNQIKEKISHGNI